MSARALKWLALGTMLLDHIGAVFFPYTMWIRCIGRMAFPLYAFLLSEGFVHTHDRKKYLLRLALFAAVSEPVFDLALYGEITVLAQNVFFTLAIGLCALFLLEKAEQADPIDRPAFFICAALLALLAELLRTDYGLYGVAMVAGFYLLRKTRPAACLSMAGLTVLYTAYGSPFQLYAMVSAVPILLYNGEPGSKKYKLLFYAIYPAHLLLIFAVTQLLR